MLALIFFTALTWAGPNLSVPYCVEVDPHWSRDRAWAHGQVRRALDQWVSFFQRYGLQANSPLAFHLQERCGSEPGALRFLIGFPVPKNLSDQPSRGGLIAIDPATTPRQLPHLLLHHLGHHFAVPRDSVPVMLEDIGEVIRSPQWEPHLGEIEMPTWRYRLEEGQTLVYAEGSAPNRLLPPGAFGLSKNGRHGLRLHVERAEEDKMILSLEVTDEDGRPRLQLRGNFRPRIRRAGAPLWPACGAALMRSAEDVRELEGFFEDGGGTRYPAVLDADPGSLLRVHVPHARDWWGVEDYPSVRPWRSNRL